MSILSAFNAPEGRISPSYIGLSRDSTLLDRLFKDDIIPSKSWGFFGGWVGMNLSTTQYGSLVLGGYDAAPVAGDFTDFQLQMDGDCALRVRIKRIQWLGKVHYQNTTGGLEACIDPEDQMMRFPTDIIESLKNTGADTTAAIREAEFNRLDDIPIIEDDAVSNWLYNSGLGMYRFQQLYLEEYVSDISSTANLRF
ncbi:hypothetical protein ABW19_dt0210453 [Dactylella cylindrospora]|nr:hypothetical protein ABW19_dt0210453 [Dactylella cylindrospora]